jgi:hypothetical protein
LAILYGIFAAAGAVIPWYFNIVWMRESGSLLTPSALVAGGFVTPLTSSLTTDFFIGTTPVLVWMVVEARRLGMRHSWAYVLGTFAVAFAFTCPLFLMMRELKINADRARRESSAMGADDSRTARNTEALFSVKHLAR